MITNGILLLKHKKPLYLMVNSNAKIGHENNLISCDFNSLNGLQHNHLYNIRILSIFYSNKFNLNKVGLYSINFFVRFNDHMIFLSIGDI